MWCTRGMCPHNNAAYPPFPCRWPSGQDGLHVLFSGKSHAAHGGVEEFICGGKGGGAKVNICGKLFCPMARTSE